MNLTDNTIFIPGATSGIGLALALHLKQHANTVIVGGRRVDRLEQIAADHPDLRTVQIDTTDSASITAARDALLADHPDVNVLITLAGIMRPEDLHTPDFLATAEATITTNLVGPIRLIAAFTPQLIAQPTAAIITVSSGLAFAPLPITPTYNATKSAVHLFTEALRVQLADTTVEVIELVPPAVRTTLMNQQNSETAMPLDEFIEESVALLGEPGVREVLVEAVKPLRYAAVNGSYDAIVAAMSTH